MTEPSVAAAPLPRPPEWSRRERPLWFTPCVTAALVAAVLTVVLGRDDILAGVLCAAAALLLVGAVLVFPLPRPVRVERVAQGVRFPFRRGSWSLELTVEGIVLTRGGADAISWAEFSEISTWSPNLGFTLWPIRQNLITLESQRPARGVLRWLFRGVGRTIRTVRLATDPVVVYHALRYYLEHPDARGELGGAEALDRIRTGRLTAED